jgi:GNAT superfamily N-acetyltransferase
MTAPEPTIRAAVLADAAAITSCVEAAYRPYIARIGMPPAPMLDDYALVIQNSLVFVLSIGKSIIGVIVLRVSGGRALLDNVALRLEHQGKGLGRTLIAFAERKATNAGCSAIELYTHELMSENIAMYCALGYIEFARRTENGYRRVYMRKSLVSNAS